MIHRLFDSQGKEKHRHTMVGLSVRHKVCLEEFLYLDKHKKEVKNDDGIEK